MYTVCLLVYNTMLEAAADKQRYLTRRETEVLTLLPFWAAPSGLFVGPEISFVLSDSHSFDSWWGGGLL